MALSAWFTSVSPVVCECAKLCYDEATELTKQTCGERPYIGYKHFIGATVLSAFDHGVPEVHGDTDKANGAVRSKSFLNFQVRN